MSKITVDHRRHVLVGTPSDGQFEEIYSDTDGNLQVRNLIYNVSDMDWEAATGSLGAGGAVEVTNFPTFHDDPLASYKITGLDSSGIPAYFGYVDKDGNWVIMQLDTGGGTALWAKGTSDYGTNWGNRGGLSYGTFDTVF